MNRRSFIKSLAVVAAPYVITTAGVLMPVRKLITGDAQIIVNKHGIVFFEHGPLPSGYGGISDSSLPWYQLSGVVTEIKLSADEMKIFEMLSSTAMTVTL